MYCVCFFYMQARETKQTTPWISLIISIQIRVFFFSCGTGEDTKSMHLYYCAGINSQSFAGAGGSGHTYCGSGRECNTYVAGAGGNGQKFGGRGRERDEENSPAQCSTWDALDNVTLAFVDAAALLDLKKGLATEKLFDLENSYATTT